MATNTRPGRRSLSDRLRGMRFMKHKEETEIREKLAAEQQAREKAAHWTLDTVDDREENMPIVLIEDGVSDNPMLGRAGRQSFGNFNPVLEMNAGKRGRKGGPKQEVEEGLKQDATEEAKEEGELEDGNAMLQAEEKPAGERRKEIGRKPKLLGVRGGIWKKESRPQHNRYRIKAKKTHKRNG